MESKNGDDLAHLQHSAEEFKRPRTSNSYFCSLLNLFRLLLLLLLLIPLHWSDLCTRNEVGHLRRHSRGNSGVYQAGHPRQHILLVPIQTRTQEERSKASSKNRKEIRVHTWNITYLPFNEESGGSTVRRSRQCLSRPQSLRHCCGKKILDGLDVLQSLNRVLSFKPPPPVGFCVGEDILVCLSKVLSTHLQRCDTLTVSKSWVGIVAQQETNYLHLMVEHSFVESCFKIWTTRYVNCGVTVSEEAFCCLENSPKLIF